MRDKEIQALIAALRQVHDEHYLSIQGLARRLGFSAGHLSMVLSGKRRPSMRFMEAAVQAFPLVRRRLRQSLEDEPPPGEEEDDAI